MQKNTKKGLTTLDKSAIIVNCIIIAYYAQKRIKASVSRKFFLYNNIRKSRRQSTFLTVRGACQCDYYFEWSD